MKIRDEIKDVLRGKIVVSKYNMEEESKFKDSPLNNMLSLNLKDFKLKKCSYCEDLCTNYCWNCEKPHCNKHAHAVFSFPMINTLCVECFNDLIKDKEGHLSTFDKQKEHNPY